MLQTELNPHRKKLNLTRLRNHSSLPVQPNPAQLLGPNHLSYSPNPVQWSLVQVFFYGSSKSWRSSLTTISPVGTSWSSNRFVIGPLEPWSFFISANRISVLPRKSEEEEWTSENFIFSLREKESFSMITDRQVRIGLVQTQWHRGRPVPGPL